MIITCRTKPSLPPPDPPSPYLSPPPPPGLPSPYPSPPSLPSPYLPPSNPPSPKPAAAQPCPPRKPAAVKPYLSDRLLASWHAIPLAPHPGSDFVRVVSGSTRLFSDRLV